MTKLRLIQNYLGISQGLIKDKTKKNQILLPGNFHTTSEIPKDYPQTSGAIRSDWYCALKPIDIKKYCQAQLQLQLQLSWKLR